MASRNCILAAAILFGSFLNPLEAQSRFHFKIDPETPLKDLLPAAPPAARVPGLFGVEELSLFLGIRGAVVYRVPEVQLADASVVAKVIARDQTEHIAYQIAKIKHINEKKSDGFLDLLQEQRPDLAGMPFLKGSAARAGKDYCQEFARAVRIARSALTPRLTPQEPATFLARFQKALAAEVRPEKEKVASPEEVQRARIAAFIQMLVVEPLPIQKELVQYLSGIAQKEATIALARLALFPFDEEIRRSALQALTKRDTKEISDLLVQGLRYPFPAVAQNAADALVALRRSDLVPQLVAFLDEPDPLAPQLRPIAGSKVWLVRELVRINHHRNCLLCHAPNDAPEVASGLTGPVPAPGEGLPTFPAEYYRIRQIPDILVRADVTYLRQDFTLLMSIPKAAPWPEMQRYDFLVRTRQLTAEEAADYQALKVKRAPGFIPANHRAALVALEQLTGRKSGPTADAWRRTLGLTKSRAEK